ncbi:MAG: hypothetical protein LBH22_05695 [Bacteroidales bacterium]|jgi:hypothetical protein|nr:hypothetical protein [Bacteroidales bacterium]
MKKLMILMMSLAVVFSACKDKNGDKVEIPGKATIAYSSIGECSDQTATLTATATNDPTSFRWRKGETLIEGETGSTLTVIENGTYYAAAVNSAGQGEWSNPRAVTVGVVGDATITGLSANDCPGNDVTLTVSATCATSFRWRKGETLIEGETGSTLVVTESGTYYAVGVNDKGEGMWSAAKTVTINTCEPPATPTISGLDANTCPTKTVTLTATITPTPSPAATLQWKKDGTVIAGQTAATLVVSASGSYTVVVTNSMGSAESAPKVVTIEPCPEPDLEMEGNFDVTSWDYFGNPRELINWNLEITQVGDKWIFGDEDLPIEVKMDEDGDYYVESFSATTANLTSHLTEEQLENGMTAFWQVAGGYVTRTGTSNNIYSINAPFRLFFETSEDGTSWKLPYQLSFNDGAITLIMGVGTLVTLAEGSPYIPTGGQPGNYWRDFQGEMVMTPQGKKGTSKKFIPNPKNQNLDASMLQLIDAKPLPDRTKK